MNTEEALMTTFGVLGGTLFLGGLQLKGRRRAVVVSSSFVLFGLTTFVGGIKILLYPEYKRNSKRNIVKGVGVEALGAGMALAGISVILPRTDTPRSIKNIMMYGSGALVVGGLAAMYTANDIANIVGWEAGDERLPWWSV